MLSSKAAVLRLSRSGSFSGALRVKLCASFEPFFRWERRSVLTSMTMTSAGVLINDSYQAARQRWNAFARIRRPPPRFANWQAFEKSKTKSRLGQSRESDASALRRIPHPNPNHATPAQSKLPQFVTNFFDRSPCCQPGIPLTPNLSHVIPRLPAAFVRACGVPGRAARVSTGMAAGCRRGGVESGRFSLALHEPARFKRTCVDSR